MPHLRSPFHSKPSISAQPQLHIAAYNGTAYGGAYSGASTSFSRGPPTNTSQTSQYGTPHSTNGSYSLTPSTPLAPTALEQPTLVNPLQYRRIILRRQARCRLEQSRATRESDYRSNSNYTHESRHKHAMKRPRGEGGRFLTKPELEVFYKANPKEKPEGWGEKRKKR